MCGCNYYSHDVQLGVILPRHTVIWQWLVANDCRLSQSMSARSSSPMVATSSRTSFSASSCCLALTCASSGSASTTPFSTNLCHTASCAADKERLWRQSNNHYPWLLKKMAWRGEVFLAPKMVADELSLMAIWQCHTTNERTKATHSPDTLARWCTCLLH